MYMNDTSTMHSWHFLIDNQNQEPNLTGNILLTLNSKRWLVVLVLHVLLTAHVSQYMILLYRWCFILYSLFLAWVITDLNLKVNLEYRLRRHNIVLLGRIEPIDFNNCFAKNYCLKTIKPKDILKTNIIRCYICHLGI